MEKYDRLCLVGVAWRIQAHFERLHSVFSVLGISTEGCITASAITRVLRESASRILKVGMSNAILKQYTPHSLRIGVYALLYNSGKSAVFIKYHLRWKLDTFMNYLHDTTIVARQHAAALSWA